MKQIFTLLSIIFSSSCYADAWDGSSSDQSWYIGNRTEYHIKNAAQLKGFADLVNFGINFENKTVYLDDDIDLNNNIWYPIGYGNLNWSGLSFAGTFDGGGHTIDRLYLSSAVPEGLSFYTSLGFFGNMSSRGRVMNLNVNSKSH